MSIDVTYFNSPPRPLGVTRWPCEQLLLLLIATGGFKIDSLGKFKRCQAQCMQGSWPGAWGTARGNENSSPKSDQVKISRMAT